MFKLPTTIDEVKGYFSEYGVENGSLALKRAREYKSWLADAS